ncbi:MAG TPA: amylo-alpha-1,6-glucosidase [Bacteroidota bacterium]|nr:amylo-alpha-1,6-glucosidase [Bacteroidota bacterium]
MGEVHPDRTSCAHVLIWCILLLQAVLFPQLLVAQLAGSRFPVSIDELRIEVPLYSSREIAFTNKNAGVLYTETNGENRSAWEGWRIMSAEVMDDYAISIDGKKLTKSDAYASVDPLQLVRSYRNGIKETVTLLDSVDAISVEVDGIRGSNISIGPLLSGSLSSRDYEMTWDHSILLIARKNHTERKSSEDYPVWIGVTFAEGTTLVDWHSDTIGTDFLPASVRKEPAEAHAEMIFVAGDTKASTIELAARVSKNAPMMISQRKARLLDLLNGSYARTDNPRFDKALQWAKISLDALIMHQVKKGIFAGLPWFDDYWGRDSFISLPGATLVTGNFTDAKEILRSFAGWQDTIPTNSTYGRIPNLVTTTSIAYNTADGTPRFIRALYDYFCYSRDTAFVAETWSVVARSIEGTLRYHCDSLGFLSHGDAETWMDAVGPEGPWSPRGNRANDIQQLWYDQLTDASRLAEIVGKSDDRHRWEDLASRVAINFRKYFVDSARHLVYDHLRSSGAPDLQIRPNEFFVFPLLQRSVSEALVDSIFTDATEKLVFPYGVSSLWQGDENFHPYHHYAPYYVQDAAYHNGVVWTWLAGPWITLCAGECDMPDLAFRVTNNMVHQMLDRGAIGTLSELLDAAPRPREREPLLSGTFSQAWSLAEFVRNFYQDYLGISVSDSGYGLKVDPSFPSDITNAVFDVILGGDRIGMKYVRTPTADYLTFAPQKLSRELPVDIWWRVSSGNTVRFHVNLQPYHSMRYRIKEQRVVEIQGQEEQEVAWVEAHPVTIHPDRSIKLATSYLRAGLKAMVGPSYPILTNREIKSINPKAAVVYDVADSVGDDHGPGSYRYPLTSSLVPGSLDITHFTVRADKQFAYFTLDFRSLSNPGWHPEYGFQLTYCAIAIDKDGRKGSGQTSIGMNSRYSLDPSYAAENIIYVGGGFRVVDQRGKTLAEYLPVAGDEKNPLGNTPRKEIQFAVPASIVGSPDPSWRYTVLVGCQDDHGGAGIGEFRSVESEAREWAGGGKRDSSASNVYDVILPKKTHR